MQEGVDAAANHISAGCLMPRTSGIHNNSFLTGGVDGGAFNDGKFYRFEDNAHCIFSIQRII